MGKSEIFHCALCGWPVDQAGTRARRLYHPHCKEFKNHLDAAARAAVWIQNQREVRSYYLKAANKARIPQLRSSDGRFVSSSDPGD